MQELILGISPAPRYVFLIGFRERGRETRREKGIEKGEEGGKQAGREGDRQTYRHRAVVLAQIRDGTCNQIYALSGNGTGNLLVYWTIFQPFE